jgi:hypothetical protein
LEFPAAGQAAETEQGGRWTGRRQEREASRHDGGEAQRGDEPLRVLGGAREMRRRESPARRTLEGSELRTRKGKASFSISQIYLSPIPLEPRFVLAR